MYCTECGANIANTVKFCTECGHPVQRPAASAQESAAPHTDTPAAEPTSESTTDPMFSATYEANFDGAPAAPTMPVRPPRRYRGRLVFAVLATIFLFIPTGVISIVQAVKAMQLSDAGEAEPALRAAKRSTLFAVLSILCNILWHGLGLVLLIKKYL